MGMKAVLRNDATEELEKESCVVRRHTGGKKDGQQGERTPAARPGAGRAGAAGATEVVLTVIGEETDVHKDRLVLCRRTGEGVGVEDLPCDGSVGVATHIRAVALAGAVPQVGEGRGRGRGRGALLGSVSGSPGALGGMLPLLLLLMALLELRPHHLGGICGCVGR